MGSFSLDLFSFVAVQRCFAKASACQRIEARIPLEKNGTGHSSDKSTTYLQVSVLEEYASGCDSLPMINQPSNFHPALIIIFFLPY